MTRPYSYYDRLRGRRKAPRQRVRNLNDASKAELQKLREALLAAEAARTLTGVQLEG